MREGGKIGSGYCSVTFFVINVVQISRWRCRAKSNQKAHFDFPAVGENIYGIKTGINQPLTGRNRRERGYGME
jgi:hypothetical protein